MQVHVLYTESQLEHSRALKSQKILPGFKGAGKNGPGKKGPGKKGPVKTVLVKTVLGINGPGKNGPSDYFDSW